MACCTGSLARFLGTHPLSLLEPHRAAYKHRLQDLPPRAQLVNWYRLAPLHRRRPRHARCRLTQPIPEQIIRSENTRTGNPASSRITAGAVLCRWGGASGGLDDICVLGCTRGSLDRAVYRGYAVWIWIRGNLFINDGSS